MEVGATGRGASAGGRWAVGRWARWTGWRIGRGAGGATGGIRLCGGSLQPLAREVVFPGWAGARDGARADAGAAPWFPPPKKNPLPLPLPVHTPARPPESQGATICHLPPHPRARDDLAMRTSDSVREDRLGPGERARRCPRANRQPPAANEANHAISPTRPTRVAIQRGAALAVALVALACGPREPAAFDWRLAEAARGHLAPADVERISALLGELFGSALVPRLDTPPELSAHGVALGAPALGRTSETFLRAVRADNGRRFGDALDDLAAGKRPSLPAPVAAQLGPLADGTDAAALSEALRDFRPNLATSARTYAAQCLTCHGREGGGDGPAAAAYSPRPRDLRLGEFQHHDRSLGERPRHEELVRVLHEGIPGGAMPSFRRYSSAELGGMADLVRLLALRGEVERRLVADVAAGRTIDVDVARAHLVEAAGRWPEVAEALAVAPGGGGPGDSPAPPPESAQDNP